MRSAIGALAITLLVTPHAAAQQPGVGVWFGISRSPNGKPTNERFEVEVRATNAVIRWAAFGRKALGPPSPGGRRTRDDFSSIVR